MTGVGLIDDNIGTSALQCSDAGQTLSSQPDICVCYNITHKYQTLGLNTFNIGIMVSTIEFHTLLSIINDKTHQGAS